MTFASSLKFHFAGVVAELSATRDLVTVEDITEKDRCAAISTKNAPQRPVDSHTRNYRRVNQTQVFRDRFRFPFKSLLCQPQIEAPLSLVRPSWAVIIFFVNSHH